MVGVGGQADSRKHRRDAEIATNPTSFPAFSDVLRGSVCDLRCRARPCDAAAAAAERNLLHGLEVDERLVVVGDRLDFGGARQRRDRAAPGRRRSSTTCRRPASSPPPRASSPAARARRAPTARAAGWSARCARRRAPAWRPAARMFFSCVCACSYCSLTRARFACAVFAPSG